MPTIRDILPPGGRIWAKPDWTWRWDDESAVYPCIAWGQAHLANAAAARARRGDLVLMIRVQDPDKSDGRPGLVEGVMAIVPNERRMTEAYVPRRILEAVRLKRGREWPHAIGCSAAWEVLGDVDAGDVCPRTRASFSRSSGESALYPVVPAELDVVLGLEVRPVPLAVTASGAAALGASEARRRLAGRVAPLLYAERVAAGAVPPDSAREAAAYARTGRQQDTDDAAEALARQGDRCALCGGAFGLGALQPVPLGRAGSAFDVAHAACKAGALHEPGRRYAEGQRRVALKEVREPVRDERVRLIALAANLARNGGRLVCDTCGNDWLDHPHVTFERSARLFEVHHRIAVAGGPSETDPIEGTAVVCTLCHKVAHGPGGRKA